jgi:hypothetical protein
MQQMAWNVEAGGIKFQLWTPDPEGQENVSDGQRLQV